MKLPPKYLILGAFVFYFILLFYFSGLKFRASGLYQISHLLLFSVALLSHPLFQNPKDTEKQWLSLLCHVLFPEYMSFMSMHVYVCQGRVRSVRAWAWCVCVHMSGEQDVGCVCMCVVWGVHVMCKCVHACECKFWNIHLSSVAPQYIFSMSECFHWFRIFMHELTLLVKT